MNPVFKLLHAHRSIRKFADKPLPEGLLDKLVSAGQAASSGNNVQAYTLIRISQKALRSQISELAGNQAYINECAEFLVFCADVKRNKEAVERAGGEPVMGMTEQLLVSSIDTALMAQNMAIAAESEGLGICYIGAIRNNPAAICELLKLPKHIYPAFGMCLGYPEQDPEVKPRLPIAVVLKENVYDDSQDEELIDQYNKQMSEYYQMRTGGTKNTSWSTELVPMFSQKLRPHMKAFLADKGFEMK